MELGLLCVAARVQELALDRDQLRAVATPVECGGQSRSPVQLAGIAGRSLPRLSRLREVPVEPEALSIFAQPRSEPRPLADQRLVRDLDALIVDRQKSCLRQFFDEMPRLSALFRFGQELAQTRTPL
jgi:hypothetical protein